MREKHGKQKKGARQTKKIMVKEILDRVKSESPKLIPFLILLADYLQDGQINGFGILSGVEWL